MLDERRVRPACHAAYVLVLGFALWTGWRGLDFGKHWDEHHITRSVRQSAETGLLLPRWYNYPSLLYDIALLTLLPDGFRVGWRGVPEEVSETDPPSPLVEVANGEPYKLRVRAVLLALSLLTSLWLYLLVLRWRDDAVEALLAAALLLGSFELAYHARWIAPDALMMSLATATMLAVVQARAGTSAQRAWHTAAAALAGLTCGSKYPGGLLLLPVLASAALGLADRGATSALAARAFRREAAAELARLAAVFALVFAVTSPGLLLEPGKFLIDVHFEMNHYATGHGGYTVDGGIDHLTRLAAYLTMEAMSPAWPVALAVAAFALGGATIALARDRRTAALLLGVPTAYVLYMSAQNVMIVRNVLVILPFVALFAAIGILASIRALPWPVTVVAGAIVVTALGYNLLYLERAARSIEERSALDHGAALDRWLRARADRTFTLSPGALALASQGELPANVVAAGSDTYLLWTADVDVRDWRTWPANQSGTYDVVSGPSEINFDYYPTWEGEPRLVAVSMARAEAAGLADVSSGDRPSP